MCLSSFSKLSPTFLIYSFSHAWFPKAVIFIILRSNYNSMYNSFSTSGINDILQTSKLSELFFPAYVCTWRVIIFQNFSGSLRRARLNRNNLIMELWSNDWVNCDTIQFWKITFKIHWGKYPLINIIIKIKKENHFFFNVWT